MNNLFCRLLPALLICGVTASAAPPTPEMITKIEGALPKEAPAKPAKARKVLIFNKPFGFRHSSIETGTKAVQLLGEKTGAFTTDVTDDPASFNPEKLAGYDAVCLVNTTG